MMKRRKPIGEDDFRRPRVRDKTKDYDETKAK